MGRGCPRDGVMDERVLQRGEEARERAAVKRKVASLKSAVDVARNDISQA
jgi:hypothetical protein